MNKRASWLQFPPRCLGIRKFPNGLTIHLDNRLLIADTGGDVWRGAVALSKFFKDDALEAVRGKRVLELASGTGLMGLNIALCGAAQVLLTDKESMHELHKKNMLENQAMLAQSGCEIQAAPLDWFCSQLHPDVVQFHFDLIVMSDVWYEEEIIEPLVNTLCSLVLAHHARCSSPRAHPENEEESHEDGEEGGERASEGSGGRRKALGGSGSSSSSSSSPASPSISAVRGPPIYICASHRSERMEDLFFAAIDPWFSCQEITERSSVVKDMAREMIVIFLLSPRDSAPWEERQQAAAASPEEGGEEGEDGNEDGEEGAQGEERAGGSGGEAGRVMQSVSRREREKEDVEEGERKGGREGEKEGGRGAAGYVSQGGREEGMNGEREDGERVFGAEGIDLEELD